MSSVAEAVKRWRLPLTWGALIAAIVLLWVAALVLSQGQHNAGPVRTGAAPRLAPPRIKQAPWRVKTFAAGAPWQMTKKDRKRLRKQGHKVTALVRDVYDTLFLEPAATPGVLKRNFLNPAASRLMHSKVGLPRRARDIQFLTRRARIGVDAPSPRRAAGTVKVVLRGKARGERFRMEHESTLWLERGDKGWQVIAYDLLQHPDRPQRAKPERGGGKGGAKDEGRGKAGPDRRDDRTDGRARAKNRDRDARAKGTGK